MNRKKLGIVAPLVLAGALAIAGCAGTATSEPSAQADSPAPSVSTSSSCRLAQSDGQSKNKELQALATTQYESIDCGGDMGAQLKTIAKDPAVQAKAKAAGATLTVGEAAGGVTLSMVDINARTSCMITVMNSMNGKTLTCGDL